MAQLQASGIETHLGLGEMEARKLNEVFFHYITTQQPFVIAKWAMSLDGQLTTNTNDSRQLSGSKAAKHTHDLRHRSDAILIGAKTLLTDNPRLTVRHQKNVKHPLRIVVSTEGLLPSHLKLLNNSLPGKTILATTNPDAQTPHADMLLLPKNSDGQVCLRSLLKALGKREISSLLVEGGRTLLNSFFKANLVNQIQVYLSPVIIGSHAAKQPVQIINCEALGNDYHISATMETPHV